MLFQNIWEAQKDTCYCKIFEGHGEIRKTKIHMWTVWLLTCLWDLNMKKKDKVRVPQWNEMLYCTSLHLVLLVKMKNIIPKKIYLMLGIWKTWPYKNLLTIENNQCKCSDYSLLFSMCADVDEQHFN